MKIEIWSDIMCPFCYIGKRNFEHALTQLPFKDVVNVEWKSFQLDASLSDQNEGITVKEYLASRKGLPVDQVEAMQQHITEKGKEVGIDFKMDQAVVVNTFLGHRLIQWAQLQGKGSEMEEALFKAHFTEGKDVSDRDVLGQLAQQIGLDKNTAVTYLKTEEGAYEVQQDIVQARNIGVQGVPFFLLNGKYSVSGAQPTELFIEAITQTYREAVVPFENQANTNDSCGIDGCN